MLKDGQIYRDNQKGIVLRVPSSHEKEITILYHSAGYVGICKTRLATQVRKGLDWCEVCQRRTWDPGGRNAFHLMSSLKHSRKSQAVMLFKSLYWLITELVLFKRVDSQADVQHRDPSAGNCGSASLEAFAPSCAACLISQPVADNFRWIAH